MNNLNTLPSFLAYFATAIALFSLSACAFLHFTPHRELELIRKGNLAAAIALVGTLVGFSLPLASCIAHSSSLLDMLVWGIVALFVQSLVFSVVTRLIPEIEDGIAAGNLAHGVMLGGSALCVGLINAACMVY